jgi:hypothetical protein
MSFAALHLPGVFPLSSATNDPIGPQGWTYYRPIYTDVKRAHNESIIFPFILFLGFHGLKLRAGRHYSSR